MEEENPIIAEIRRARDVILSEHHGDLARLVKHLQARTEEAARAGRKVYSPSSHQPKRKAG